MSKVIYCIEEDTEIKVDDKIWLDSKELLVYRVEEGSDLILLSDLMWREKKELLTKEGHIYPSKIKEVTETLSNLIGYINRGDWSQAENLLAYEDRCAYIEFGDGVDIGDILNELQRLEREHITKVPEF